MKRDVAIAVDNLSRAYVVKSGWVKRRQRIATALDRISFTVEQGELFGLLGPNGAGKTTTIRILSTLLLPDSGRAAVLGMDVAADTRALRRRIGFLFGGERGLYGRISAWDNLRYFADLYDVPFDIASRRMRELLELVGLAERAGDRVQTFSRGMKQRLHLARVLLHDPEVLYLDEPTLGLDPVGAREIRSLISRLASRGRTILLSTHYMPEAEELCDRIAIINRGKIIGSGSLGQLAAVAADLHVLEVRTGRLLPEALGHLRALTTHEAELRTETVDGGHLLRIQSPRAKDLVGRVLNVLQECQITSVVVRGPTLEDVYLRLVQPADEVPKSVEAHS